jgi:hypothetical protein
MVTEGSGISLPQPSRFTVLTRDMSIVCQRQVEHSNSTYDRIEHYEQGYSPLSHAIRSVIKPPPHALKEQTRAPITRPLPRSMNHRLMHKIAGNGLLQAGMSEGQAGRSPSRTKSKEESVIHQRWSTQAPGCRASPGVVLHQTLVSQASPSSSITHRWLIICVHLTEILSHFIRLQLILRNYFFHAAMHT